MGEKKIVYRMSMSAKLSAAIAQAAKENGIPFEKMMSRLVHLGLAQDYAERAAARQPNGGDDAH